MRSTNQRGEPLQDRRQLDPLVEVPEVVHGLLQPLGDRQVPGFDDVPAVRPRGGATHDEQVVDLPVDEVLVAPDVALVDVEAGCCPEEPLERGDVHRSPLVS
jgi:hypothetical protein